MAVAGVGKLKGRISCGKSRGKLVGIIGHSHADVERIIEAPLESALHDHGMSSVLLHLQGKPEIQGWIIAGAKHEDLRKALVLRADGRRRDVLHGKTEEEVFLCFG